MTRSRTYSAAKPTLPCGYVAASDPDVVRVVPELAIAPLPVWVICHREIRNNPRLRRVFDFLAENIPARLDR